VLGEAFTSSFAASEEQQAAVIQELVELAALLAGFLFILAGVFLIQKTWHRRPLKAILTSASRFRWGNLCRAMAVAFTVLLFTFVAQLLAFPAEWEQLNWASDPAVYIAGVLICVLFVPFQAASEELLFRGYFNQAFIRYVPSPWGAYLISSVGFSLLHAFNAEAESNLLPFLTIIFIIGLGMSVLVHMEGGLESAMGYHIANNLLAFCLIGYETPDMPETSLLYFSGPIVITWWSVLIELANVSLVVAMTVWWNRRKWLIAPTEER